MLIAIGYLDLKYLPPPYLKQKTHFLWPRNVKPTGNRGLHISASNWVRKLKFGTWTDMLRSFNNDENFSARWRIHTTATPSWILGPPHISGSNWDEADCLYSKPLPLCWDLI